MAREGPVARVVRRDGHDGPRPVAGQHVVRDVDRDGLAGEGIDGVRSCRHAAYAFGLGDALTLGAFLGLADVLLDGGLVAGRGQFAHPLVFGGDDHEGHAEYRVGAGGEYFEFARRILYVEEDLGPLRTADPVALDLFQRVAPCEPVQPVEHALGVGRHAQKPLFHPFLLDRMAAAHRKPVVHFVVGEHGSQRRAPVDHRVGTEREAVVVERPFLLLLRHGAPFFGREMQFLRAGHVQSLGAALFEGRGQLFDWARLLLVIAVIGAEHLEERPLRPFVIGGVASAHLAIPVEREPDLVELLAVAGDVLLGGHGRVLAGLDGVLLGGQAESVVAHRVQDVEPFLAFVARVDVRGDIAQRVTHVQAGARRVGEHVEHVEFGPRRVGLDLVGFIFLPAALPLGLDLLEIVLHSSS